MSGSLSRVSQERGQDFLVNFYDVSFGKTRPQDRVELEKNAFGSGLYIPWRGTYWVARIFFLKSAILKHPNVHINAFSSWKVYSS